MKAYGVSTQMKLLQQYFHMALFIFYVLLTFQSVHENLWCHHSKNLSSAVLSHIIIRSSVSIPKSSFRHGGIRFSEFTKGSSIFCSTLFSRRAPLGKKMIYAVDSYGMGVK